MGTANSVGPVSVSRRLPKETAMESGIDLLYAELGRFGRIMWRTI